MLNTQPTIIFNNEPKTQSSNTNNNNENRRNIVVNGKTMTSGFASTSTAPQRRPLQDIRPSQANVIQPPLQTIQQGWNTNMAFPQVQKEYSHFSQENSHFFPPKQLQQSVEFIKPIMLQQSQTNYSLFENNPLQSSTDTNSSMAASKTSISTSVDLDVDFDDEPNVEEDEQDQQLSNSRYQEEEEDTTLVDYASEEEFDEDEVLVEEDEFAPLPTDPSVINIDDIISQRNCPEYAATIFRNLKKLERNYCSNPRYMEENHSDINSRMREVLISWLNEVVEELKLRVDTLYHTVNYLDRYLSTVPNCKKNKLQLVGTTCCWIASKFYETSPPPLADFVEITRCTYTREEFIQMEIIILNRLEFNLNPITSHDFVMRYLQSACLSSYPPELIHMSNYFVELTLQEYCMLHYSPSQIALSAVVLALKILNLPYWSPTMCFYSGYRGHLDLSGCLDDLIHLHNRMVQETDLQLTSVRDKYCKSKYCNIAKRLLPIPMREKPFAS